MNRPVRRRRVRSGALGLTALCLTALGVTSALGGCGAPAPGTTSTIDPKGVPYHLLDPDSQSSSFTPSAPTAATTGVAVQQVWFVKDAKLVPSQVRAGQSFETTTQQAEDLLKTLRGGPTNAQRQSGLATALSPGLTLRLRFVAGTVAHVVLQENSDPGPAAGEAPLATGQIVLSLTSIAGIDAVVFDDGTNPLQVPLPGGALTGSPVHARDYRSLAGG